MANENAATKPVRQVRSLEDEITKARDKLRRLEEQHREQQRKEREKNAKAVLELLKSEKLDIVPAELWKDALPKIRALLAVNEGKSDGIAKDAPGAAIATAPKATEPGSNAGSEPREAEAAQ
ncbi:hypothetical protein WK78_03010 [Burkholderia cepacia]|uniref:hypothetical protein n=1 Tax=Burkholderia cepacia TaxID=292 RepID=UPI00076DF31D|nr:hypothetical protein [Burkholderia cepacia]KVV25078.1 hypothetical protein WK78_03010 [Burkholderia cepacia]